MYASKSDAPFLKKDPHGKKSHSVTRDGQAIITVKPGTVVSSMMSHGSNHSSKQGTFGGAKRLTGSGTDKPRRMIKRDESGCRKEDKDKVFQSNAAQVLSGEKPPSQLKS